MKCNSQEVVLQVLILMQVFYACKVIRAKVNGDTDGFLTGTLVVYIGILGSNGICNGVEAGGNLYSIRTMAVTRTNI